MEVLIEKILLDENVERLNYLLENSNFESLFENLNFLSLLLDMCNKIKVKKNFLEIIFNHFIKIQNLQNYLDIEILLCSVAIFKISSIKYVYNFFPWDTYTLLEKYLISKIRGDISLIYSISQKITSEKLTLGGLTSLLQISKNEIDKNFINSLIKEKQEYEQQEYPDWVDVLENEKNLKIESLDENYFNIEPIDEDINELENHVKNMCVFNKEIENLTDIIKISLSSFSNSNKNSNIDPDRIFGPRNAIIENECISGIKGGCRMLSCTCKENEEEWFYNSCDACLKKIRDPSHALRFPLNGGGWIGCYCSLICLVKQPPLNFEDDDENSLEFTELRLDNMQSTIETKKIYDRFKKKK